ncbi:MAG: hypothetical protein HWN81_09620 [Candidatus Lokiarchaeota archaeon]|nr:hypothetical protein [Candidatus Lokiarchaeota archaeon]
MSSCSKSNSLISNVKFLSNSVSGNLFLPTTSVFKFFNFWLLDQKFEKIKNSNVLFYRKEVCSSKIPLLKYAIIDFEGDPTTLVGITIANQIFQLYVKDLLHQAEFFNLILELLFILRDFYLFSFSNYEQRVIQGILESLGVFSSEKYLFVRNLKIINLQKFSFEALIPALYSINKDVYNDPLLRDSKKVNLHFKQGHYDLILDHNRSCLLSILKIVKYRYLKEVLI